MEGISCLGLRLFFFLRYLLILRVINVCWCFWLKRRWKGEVDWGMFFSIFIKRESFEEKGFEGKIGIDTGVKGCSYKKGI